jgi:hypothetical protein
MNALLIWILFIGCFIIAILALGYYEHLMELLDYQHCISDVGSSALRSACESMKPDPYLGIIP